MKNNKTPRKHSRRPSSTNTDGTTPTILTCPPPPPQIVASPPPTNRRLKQGASNDHKKHHDSKKRHLCTICRCPVSEYICDDLLVSDLEDVNPDTFGGQGCADANPIVAQNLRRIAVRAARLAFLVEYGDAHSHAPSILEAQWLLEQYRTAMPMALDEQLEAAYGWLPLGLLEYTSWKSLPTD